jgi:hypothetical protein
LKLSVKLAPFAVKVARSKKIIAWSVLKEEQMPQFALAILVSTKIQMVEEIAFNAQNAAKLAYKLRLIA